MTGDVRRTLKTLQMVLRVRQAQEQEARLRIGASRAQVQAAAARVAEHLYDLDNSHPTHFAHADEFRTQRLRQQVVADEVTWLMARAAEHREALAAAVRAWQQVERDRDLAERLVANAKDARLADQNREEQRQNDEQGLRIPGSELT
jgi:flagellar biosynthesis chaperone FliJ